MQTTASAQELLWLNDFTASLEDYVRASGLRSDAEETERVRAVRRARSSEED